MGETSLPEINWDKPYYYVNAKKFIPSIFDGILPQFINSFNTITLAIDGQVQADLNWKGIREQAYAWIEQGYAILWEIELGLFSKLDRPLNNQTQYLSLGLSLEHFRDTLWKEFQHRSLGLILYRGSVDLSLGFPWTEQQESNLRGWIQDQFVDLATLKEETQLVFSDFEDLNHVLLSHSEIGKHLVSLFCRDVAIEYLALLASRLPDSLPCYVLLDATLVRSPLRQAQLLHPERFDQLNLAIKKASIPLQAWGWESPSSYGTFSKSPIHIPSAEEVKVGVCLPSIDRHLPSQYQGLGEALDQLLAKQVNFRLIPETHLITDWDGLDYLLYIPAGLSAQGKRKLQGFCAAGGTVVTLGKPLGLPYEISWPEYRDIY
jgi:hypothetical protein